MKRPQTKPNFRDNRFDAPRRPPSGERHGQGHGPGHGHGGRHDDNYGAPPRGGRPQSFEGGDRPPRRTFRQDDGAGSRGAPWGRPTPRFDRDRDRDRDGAAPRHAPAEAREAAPAAVSRSFPVPGHRLKDGLRAANRALAELLEGFGTQVEGTYDIPEIEVEVSFDQQGRFMGFGRGGSVTFKLTLAPLDAEDILTHANDDEDLDDEDEVEPDEAPVAEVPAAPKKRAKSRVKAVQPVDAAEPSESADIAKTPPAARHMD